jgi:sulfur-oxidizing protein SoxY
VSASRTFCAPGERGLLSRRGALALGAMGLVVHARAGLPADAPALAAALARFADGGSWREGRVQLELPELVENGNAVPVSISVDGLGSAGEQVTALALFTARNPAPEVAVFTFLARLGPVRVSTRMRLATSQAVVAAARMSDGSVWMRRIDVLVTLAACVEG